jgi:hypothetical protein
VCQENGTAALLNLSIFLDLKDCLYVCNSLAAMKRIDNTRMRMRWYKIHVMGS